MGITEERVAVMEMGKVRECKSESSPQPEKCEFDPMGNRKPLLLF